MDELAIRNLNNWERKKLKRTIIDTIKDKETAKRITEQEALLNMYKKKIEENKKRMIEYEFDITSFLL